MNEVTELQVKEALREAFDKQVIEEKEYKAIQKALQEGEVSPIEIYDGYLPFKMSNARHR